MKLVRNYFCVLALMLMGTACGFNASEPTSSIKVIGGREASEDDKPMLKSVVRLDILRRDGIGLCTGVLISPVHVLTAAHCVEQMEGVVAWFGVNKQSELSDKLTETHARFSKWAYKGNFVMPEQEIFEFVRNSGDAEADENKDKKVWDLAVIRLESEAPDFAEPAALTPPSTLSGSIVGAKLIGAGYGLREMPEELRKAKEEFEGRGGWKRLLDLLGLGALTSKMAPQGWLTPEDLENLEKQAEEAPLGPQLPDPSQEDLFPLNPGSDEEPTEDPAEQKVGDLMVLDEVLVMEESKSLAEFYAANENFDRALCQGDSGGPIFATSVMRHKKTGETKQVLTVLGIASKSDCEGTSIYTDVRHYVEWLETEALPGVDKAYEEEKAAIEAQLRAEAEKAGLGSGGILDGIFGSFK